MNWIRSFTGCWVGLFWLLAAHAQYTPDLLGDGYVSRSIRMPDDYEGKVVCTLVKKEAPQPAHRAVLYVHGYNDYFFQSQLGDSLAAHGYNFYAVDLRKYGRSLLAHQEPFFCKDIKEYYADLDTSLAVITAEGNTDILLMGHSTGGLIASLYLNDRPGRFPVSRLALNSPFLDMNMSWFMEKIAIPVVSFIGKFFPRLKVQGYSLPMYAYSLLAEYKGEWEFNTGWKKITSHPKRAGWLRAIYKGQQKVRNGLHIHVPVLVLSSARSAQEKEEWSDEYLRSDIVLDVHDIQKYGARLGTNVTRDTIPNGLHDLILSPEPARSQVYRILFNWLSSAF